MPRSLALLIAFLAASTSPAPAQIAPGSAGLPKLKVEVAYPKLTFDRPVSLDSPSGGGNRLFVAEQHSAKIFSFEDSAETSTKDLFLTLPRPINRGNEEGLLGLAFHPKYAEIGEFFVYYSANDEADGHRRRSVVSRFKVSKDDPTKADPKSEQRIWVSADDPYENHNGGCILFGPDGFLYITLGDGGAADDPNTTGQNPADHFGSILRIDVDNPSDGKPYGIPKDNPKLRNAKFAKWAPEVYCIGLRNVWKFSFDSKTGDLWAGDVGQNKWEMVHLIENGGNYGWSINEAFHPFRPKQKVDKASPISKPLAEYPHDLNLAKGRTDIGRSITGGYVYRGKAVPALDGVYLYGDFETGRIWGLREKGHKATVSGEVIKADPARLKIAAFGEDHAGEVLVLSFDGKIYKFAAE
jgi:glucose/arabinose dehydrogenase